MSAGLSMRLAKRTNVVLATLCAVALWTALYIRRPMTCGEDFNVPGLSCSGRGWGTSLPFGSHLRMCDAYLQDAYTREKQPRRLLGSE